MKNKNEIEKYNYLEQWLKDNYPKNMHDDQVIAYFRDNFSDEKDVAYLFRAYLLPYKMINRVLIKCNNNEGRLFKEAHKISKNYNGLSVKVILNRFKEVKIINAKKKFVKPVKKNINNSKMIDKYLAKTNGDLIDRKVILEMALRNYDLKGLNNLQLYKFFRNYYSTADSLYLLKAYTLPLNEILNDIRNIYIPNHLLDSYITKVLVPKYSIYCAETIKERIEEAMVIEKYQNNKKLAKHR